MADAREEAWSKLMIELEQAQSAYAMAKQAKEKAGRDETNTRNRLNKAQQAIDSYVASLRKQAPWNTDWHDQQNRKAEPRPWEQAQER